MNARATDPNPLAAAAIGALMEARWESRDLLSRRSTQLTPDLLRGHAAELASSSVGRDQVLSVALEAAAGDLEEGRAPLADGALFFFHEPASPAHARGAIRRAVLGEGGIPAADSERVVADLEKRHRTECAESAELSRRLAADARLHELLWDDPRLPANGRTRLVMLLSVAKLLERAEALDPIRARAGRKPKSVAPTSAPPEARQRAMSPSGHRPLGMRSWKSIAAPAAGWSILVALIAAAVLIAQLPR